MSRRQDHRPPKFRAGFTLVELMVVIVIIGILMALLLPVIVGAVRRANDARISGEIQTLAAGLARFKDVYGEYPPSRVILSEQGCYSADRYTASPTGQIIGPGPRDYSIALSSNSLTSLWVGAQPPTLFAAADISLGTLAERSLRSLRKFFPRMTAPVATLWHDFNGNNVLNSGFLYLEGHECLVFFLGGIPNPTANADGSVGYGMTGFGKDPRLPFTNVVVSTNRTQPSYEFQGPRLYDDDNDGIPGYLDPLSSRTQGRFYAYFTSYGAAGYDPNDENKPAPDEAETTPLAFRVGQPIGTNVTLSPPPNPYTTSLPAQPDTSSRTGFTEKQPANYMNASSFQLISAGGDHKFGPGGQYSSSGDKLPEPPNPPYTNQTSGIRALETDNVTNFTSGRLN